jgi:nucleotide-binding universal stress UspA family protein
VGVRAVTGELLPRAALRALEIDAALIAIDDLGVRAGARATALAHAAGRPVLVARSRSTSGAIVAATDLERPELPVMSPAALLARRLDVPMVAVHNVLPISVILGEDLREPVPIPPDEVVIEWTQERLAAAAAGMVACTEPVIRHALDPATAILEEAEARDADLVVVGTRRRSWFDRSGSGSVATRVVDRCERSVLVLPIGEGIRI